MGSFSAAALAAAAIRDAEVIVIGAGAGMGVDSGLPDFRGDQGFWKAYPPYERLGISFEVLRCPRCGAVARPNILMFGDLAWAPYRGFEQKKLFDAFLASQRGRRIVAIELGAGTAIPSVRRLSEGIAARDRTTLVRVNPREPQGPDGTISIAAGALEGLRAIDAELADLTGGHAAVETAAAPPLVRPKVH